MVAAWWLRIIYKSRERVAHIALTSVYLPIDKPKNSPQKPTSINMIKPSERSKRRFR